MSKVAKQKWIAVSAVVIVPALLIALLLLAQAQAASTGAAEKTTGTETVATAPPKVIELPAPNLDGKMSLEKALATRRSVHSISGKALTNEQLGQLAWAGQGITEKNKGLRTAPSAMARYPIKLYFATPTGLYLYVPQKHAFEVITDKDVRAQVSKQVAQASCGIIIAGNTGKNTTAPYGSRADKWTILEAGHIAENLLLEATAMGLSSVPLGGFANVTEAGKLCNLPETMEPIYLVAIGNVAQ